MSRVASISISVIVLVFAPAMRATADYEPMTLFELLTGAEIIVRGDIRNVTTDSYDLVVERAYRPAETPQVLHVARIDRYRLDERWADYAEGQSVVVFAEPRERADDPIRPSGAAGEGELPTDGEYVYVRALSRPPDRLDRGPIPGGTQLAYRLDAAGFDRAIAGFFSCYRPSETPRIVRICETRARDAYRESSWLAAHLSGIAERLIGQGN